MRVSTSAKHQIPTLSTLAAAIQTDPRFHCPYLGETESSIFDDLIDLDLGHIWVARDEGEIVGWLAADIDAEVDRVWWWGPFAAEDRWESVADDLYREAAAAVTMSGEEFAFDDRAELPAVFALARGFTAEEASAILTLDSPSALRAEDVVSYDPERHHTVPPLHESLFPGTHTTGAGLGRRLSDRFRMHVHEVEGTAVGYVASDLTSDGSLFIEFLGVEPTHRNHGFGRSLVAAASADGFARGATSVALSVRETNTAARRLYEHLGFEEERLVRPFRKGIEVI